jgi:hypothetical protein
MNRLRKAVRDYLTMRRGLGFKLVRHEAGLRESVLFLARKRSARITVNLAMEWATQDANHTPNERAARLTIVARLRTALERDGPLDRGSASRSAALPTTLHEPLFCTIFGWRGGP